VQLARSFTRKFERKPCELSDAHVSKRMMKTSEYRRVLAQGTVVKVHSTPSGRRKTRRLFADRTKSKCLCRPIEHLYRAWRPLTSYTSRNHSQISPELVHPKYVVLVPPLNMHIRARGRLLLHMYEYARQFGLRLALENLDLVDEHVAELLLVLDQKVCEPLHVRRAW
jgi:hypothetical protein